MTDDYIVEGQLSIYDLGIWCGKMSAEHSIQTREKTSDVCWKRWQGSAKNPSLFLDLRRESGVNQESSSETLTPSHGECSMLNIGESLKEGSGFALSQILMATQQQKSYSTRLNNTDAPNNVVPSHLSEILERNPDPKYNLSPKACQGILNRAERRGKKLPPMLKEALEQVIRLSKTELHSSRYGRWKSSCDIIKDKSPTLCTTHYGEPAVCYKGDGSEAGEKTFAIVGDHENRPTDMTNLVISMDRETFNVGQNFAQTLGIHEDGIQPTIVSRGPGAVCYTSSHGRFMTNFSEGTAHTLEASDYKDAPLIAYPDVVRVRYVVRRLTPLECERLQGLPDNWTNIGEWVDSNGKKHKLADSHRYKAIGNGIALPSWRWVLKRLCANYERPATMASLFDGIGSFPLIWEQLNGKGTCLWASEIEEFPIAVTKERLR